MYNNFILELEFTGLGLNLTTTDDNKCSTIIWTKIKLMEFLFKAGCTPTPFTFRNVKFQLEPSRYAYASIKEFIANYSSFQTSVSPNFIAISPDNSVQLIVRFNHLIFFPKYFENWSIFPFSAQTCLTFKAQYNLIHNLVLSTKNIKWKVTNILELCLQYNLYAKFHETNSLYRHICNESNIDAKFFDLILSEYEHLGILQPFINHTQYIPNWLRFCSNFKNNYFMYQELNLFPTSTKFNDINTPPIQKQQNSIKAIVSYFNNLQFFDEYFDTFENQEQLFVDVPLDLAKRTFIH
jgi:hypothetical protein